VNVEGFDLLRVKKLDRFGLCKGRGAAGDGRHADCRSVDWSPPASRRQPRARSARAQARRARGKTPVLTEEQPRYVLESIDTTPVMTYTLARIGAVATAR
jgi:hypothetical protein